MTGKAQIVSGLDIGTAAVRVVVGEILADRKVNIMGLGKIPSRGMRKGVVINIESTIEAISQAVSQAESMAGVKIDSVYASLSGSHLKSFDSHGIVGIRNKEVTHQDVEKVIEAAKAVAIPLDREVIHVLPQEFIVDDQDGIKEPLGISGVRLEARVHMVSGATASAQNIVKCANRSGLSVRDIVLAALASAKAVLSPEEQELGVCLVDIGAGTADLIIYHAGAVRYTAVIPLGGNHFTNDIAAGIRTPIAAAEEIKCRFGCALASATIGDETIEVPSAGDRSSRIISKQVLSEIIEPRATELFTLLSREVEKSRLGEHLRSGVVLTGGCSNLAGIAQIAEKVMNLPIRLGVPRSVGGINDLVNSAEFSSSVGLLLHVAQSGTLASFNRSSGNSVWRLLSGWLAEHF